MDRYQYFKRIAEVSKNNMTMNVNLANYNTVFESKFNCIFKCTQTNITNEEIPILNDDVNIYDYEHRFKKLKNDFLKELPKLYSAAHTPQLHFLIKYVNELYDEIFDKLIHRIFLLSSTDDQHVRAYFKIVIIIEKVFENIKNIFIG